MKESKASREQELDVLVVGAGPTGLVMASELASRGMRCRIVDKVRERSDKSRALVVQSRSLELFQKMGIADALIERGQRGSGIQLFVDKRVVLSVDLSDVMVPDAPYPFFLIISQAETERFLDEHLHHQGLEVERPVALVGFDDEGDGVRARLINEDSGREESVRARYLIGCDGAHSAVRKGAGLSFEGAPYEQEFILADVDVDWAEACDRLFVFMTRRGIFGMFPMGQKRFRLISSRVGHGTIEGDPTVAEFEGIAKAMCPFPMKLGNASWLARFRLHHRGVNRYRKGNVFVAGDAAHIHSPAGGQGMNTGIQDAYNLAWKLALVHEGRAFDSLLDSYHDERFPIGQALLSTTDRMFSFATSANPIFTRVRSLLAPRLMPKLVATRERRSRIFRFVSQLGIKYSRSPIVSESLEDTSAWFRRGPRAGDRAPDARLVLVCDGSETTLFARATDSKHILFVFEGRSSRDWAAPLARVTEELNGYLGLCDPHIVTGGGLIDAAAPTHIYADPGGLAHDRYGLIGAGVYLIRPDGYIAFRSEGTSLDALLVYLRRVYNAE